jgi:hypothetical protein
MNKEKQKELIERIVKAVIVMAAMKFLFNI